MKFLKSINAIIVDVSHRPCMGQYVYYSYGRNESLAAPEFLTGPVYGLRPMMIVIEQAKHGIIYKSTRVSPHTT